MTVADRIEDQVEEFLRVNGGKYPDTVYLGREEEIELVIDSTHQYSRLDETFRGMKLFVVNSKNHMFVTRRER